MLESIDLGFDRNKLGKVILTLLGTAIVAVLERNSQFWLDILWGAFILTGVLTMTRPGWWSTKITLPLWLQFTLPVGYTIIALLVTDWSQSPGQAFPRLGLILIIFMIYWRGLRWFWAKLRTLLSARG